MDFGETKKSQQHRLSGVGKHSALRWDGAVAAQAQNTEALLSLAKDAKAAKDQVDLSRLAPPNLTACQTRSRLEISEHASLWNREEHKRTLVLLSLQRLSAMEGMIRYKTGANNESLRLQDMSSPPGLSDVKRIKTAFTKLVLKQRKEDGL